MKDYMVRGTGGGGQIRVVAVASTGVVEEARRRHRTTPVATAALGRLLTAAAIMGVDLQREDTLTLRLLGNGPLGAVVAVADPGGLVRGYVQEPMVDLPPRVDGKLDVARAVGGGTLVVARDLGLREPYVGSVPLITGEIAEDITNYYLVSEQIPSAMALGVLVDRDHLVLAAGGWLVQLMPGHGEDIAEQLETNISRMGPVSRDIERGLVPEEMVHRLLDGLEPVIYGCHPITFACRCNRSRLAGLLAALGKDELEEMRVQERGAEIKCHFCGEYYHFSAEDLVDIIAGLSENNVTGGR